jgi:hypothetical protein
MFNAVCTKHLDWSDGSTMTAHATEAVGPDNKPITARMVIAGMCWMVDSLLTNAIKAD